MRSEGRAVLLCTHNLDEVERVADRVAVLRSRLVAVGTTSALRRQVFAPRLRIHVRQAADAFISVLQTAGVGDIDADGHWLSLAELTVPTPAIVRILVEAGAEIEAVEPEERSLEDVYLELLHRGGAPE
jgi:ABC-2 type transport system ATP-binding protein